MRIIENVSTPQDIAERLNREHILPQFSPGNVKWGPDLLKRHAKRFLQEWDFRPLKARR